MAERYVIAKSALEGGYDAHRVHALVDLNYGYNSIAIAISKAEYYECDTIITVVE